MKKRFGCLVALVAAFAAMPPAAAQGTKPTVALKDTPGGVQVDDACTPPVTEQAYKNGVMSTTYLDFRVSAKGDVLEARLASSSRYRDLDQLAAEHLARCKFTPARKGGYAVESWVRVRHVWEIIEGKTKVIYKPFAGNIITGSHCFPPRARNKEAGSTRMSFLVGVNGRALDAKLLEPSSFPDLDRGALSSLAQCKFDPVRIDGKPVQAWIDIIHEWEELPAVTVYYGKADTRVVHPTDQPDNRVLPRGWTPAIIKGRRDESHGAWFIHLASFKSQASVQKFADELYKEQQYDLTMLTEQQDGNAVYHVVAGPFRRSQDTRQMAGTLESRGHRAVVLKQPG